MQSSHGTACLGTWRKSQVVALRGSVGAHGMGMPTVPAYLIVILVMGPAIEIMGVPTIIAHLFVVYFGVLSSITPPVAIAAFAAAPIAKANPIAIGVDACKIALIGFIIPFVMVYNHSFSLVVDFDFVEFIWICLRLSLAIWLFSTGFSGYASQKLPMAIRVARIAIGFSIMMPNIWLEAASTAIAAYFAYSDWRSRERDEQGAVTT